MHLFKTFVLFLCFIFINVSILMCNAQNVSEMTSKVNEISPISEKKVVTTTTTTVTTSGISDKSKTANELLAKSLVLLKTNNKTNTNVTTQVHETLTAVDLHLRNGDVNSVVGSVTTSATPRNGSSSSTVSGIIRRRFTVGKVRLVGGRSEHEGNVEIFYMGRWGSVCDDEWDLREASVICRQLGYTKAVKATDNSQFGLSRKRIWMDNLYCYGDELNITSCPFDGWGNHDCSAQEAAGVVCEEEPSGNNNSGLSNSGLGSETTELLNTNLTQSSSSSSSLPTLSSLVLRDESSAAAQKSRIRHALPGPLQIRIVGGRVREEGRVEIRLGDGPWGLICGDGWGIFEATATCKMLGLGHAQAAVQSSFFGGHHLPMLLSGVRCSGRENSLADCDHDQMGAVFCPGRTENIAGVICTEILPDLTPDHFELERSAYLEDRQLFFLQCAMEENCLARSAYNYDQSTYGWQLEVRRLLRFTAKIANIGNADFRPFVPKNLWQWHMCHMHYHSMEVFANFDIIDGSGRKIAEGHKASFCLEDNACSPNVQAKYVCANYGDQGISVGCTDIYLHTVDCQWIDITDVKPGVYFLKVSINPDFKVPEITFDNNAAICNVYYNSYQIHVWNCTITRP